MFAVRQDGLSPPSSPIATSALPVVVAHGSSLRLHALSDLRSSALAADTWRGRRAAHPQQWAGLRLMVEPRPFHPSGGD